ncbi:MAG TPA: T9SS type A sorting domain-containing protein [Bacteroidia bacterium]|nr:T9SS type A sorting domain-containing protein [Bacteroidia bacterium]
MKKNTLIIIFFILISISSDAQWTRISNDTSFYYTSVWFLNKDTGFVCGDEWWSINSVILRTLDGGISWDTTLFPGGFWYLCVQFANDTTGYVVGQDGDVFKTYDMGNTWQQEGSCWIGLDMTSMFFVTRDTGFFVSMYSGQLSRMVIPPSPPHFCLGIAGNFGESDWPGTGSLRFLNRQHGYVAGGHGKFAKTSDGGDSWQAFNGDTNIFVLSAWMSDTSHAVMAGTNGNVSVTNNGGISWSPTISISQHPVLDIAFVNNQKGYAVGGADAYYWQVLNTSPKGIIWKTEDGGYTWTIDDSSWYNQITSLFIVNDSLAYAVGYSGIIFKNSNLYYDGINEIYNNGNNISLFPNPATTEIKIENVKSKIESVEVYDVMGKEIKYLIPNPSPSGEGSASIDVSELAAGIYFVKVFDGERSVVKRFVKM